MQQSGKCIQDVRLVAYLAMGILLNHPGVFGKYSRADEPCGALPRDGAAIDPLAPCIHAHMLRSQREPL